MKEYQFLVRVYFKNGTKVTLYRIDQTYKF